MTKVPDKHLQAMQQQSTTPPENTRYCRGCQQRQPVTFDDPGEEKWYQENVSIVRCGECGDSMGHLVWWPSRDEDYTSF